MATSAVSAADVQLFHQLAARDRFDRRMLRLARRHPLGALSAAILFALVVVAIFAPVIATGDPFKIQSSAVLQKPSGDHWFGTDNLGRDAFSRIVYGARISLWVGLVSVAIGTGLGTPAGLVSAFAGRWVDYAIQRVVDALFAFPTIVLALAIVSVLGKGITQVIIAVGILGAPRVARIVRASTLGVMGQPYVEAARSVGAAGPRIMFKHILPNVMAPIVILASAGFGGAILAEASLSFLGLGTPPPQPSWGAMLSGAAQQYVRVAPWLAVFPGLAISIAVFAFNLFGDALRDILDPRLRGS
jgi:peptide/nickel transport system permease protein